MNANAKPPEGSLKNCPFCGAKPNHHVITDEYGDYIHEIYCSNCYILMDSRCSLALLMSRWNKRN